MGPFGPRFVSGWTSMRFNHPPSGRVSAPAMTGLLIQAKGSGEYGRFISLPPGAGVLGVPSSTALTKSGARLSPKTEEGKRSKNTLSHTVSCTVRTTGGRDGATLR